MLKSIKCKKKKNKKKILEIKERIRRTFSILKLTIKQTDIGINIKINGRVKSTWMYGQLIFDKDTEEVQWRKRLFVAWV